MSKEQTFIVYDPVSDKMFKTTQIVSQKSHKNRETEMRRVRKNPVKNPKPSFFECYVMDSKETFQEEILEIIRYTEATVGSIDDKTK